MSIELRWLERKWYETIGTKEVATGYSVHTERILQYRTYHRLRDLANPEYETEDPVWSAWTDVPTVTDSEAKP